MPYHYDLVEYYIDYRSLDTERRNEVLTLISNQRQEGLVMGAIHFFPRHDTFIFTVDEGADTLKEKLERIGASVEITKEEGSDIPTYEVKFEN